MALSTDGGPPRAPPLRPFQLCLILGFPGCLSRWGSGQGPGSSLRTARREDGPWQVAAGCWGGGWLSGPRGSPRSRSEPRLAAAGGGGSSRACLKKAPARAHQRLSSKIGKAWGGRGDVTGPPSRRPPPCACITSPWRRRAAHPRNGCRGAAGAAPGMGSGGKGCVCKARTGGSPAPTCASADHLACGEPERARGPRASAPLRPQTPRPPTPDPRPFLLAFPLPPLSALRGPWASCGLAPPRGR